MTLAFDDSYLAPAGYAPPIAVVVSQGNNSYLHNEIVNNGSGAIPQQWRVQMPGGTCLTVSAPVNPGSYTVKPGATVAATSNGNGWGIYLDITYAGGGPPYTVASATIHGTNNGGHLVGDTFTPVGGTGTAATFTAATVANNVVVLLPCNNGIVPSPSSNPVSLTGGSGASLTANITWGATYQSICALPNYTVYNVKTGYGAVGDGVTDDTVAIRNAKAAAEANGSGIVYFPAGTYAVAPQIGDDTSQSWNANHVPVGPIFLFGLNASNIIFIGDGYATTKIRSYVRGSTGNGTVDAHLKPSAVAGLLDGATYYWETGNGTFPYARGCLFQIGGDEGVLALGTYANIQWRSLTLQGISDGNAYNSDAAATGVPDGWDQLNKCINISAANTSGVVVFNCVLQYWRGEIFYAGTPTANSAYIINTSIRGCNASAISCSFSLVVKNCVIGGSTAGYDVFNSMENFCNPGSIYAEDCTIQCRRTGSTFGGYGVGLLSPISGTFVVNRCTFANNAGDVGVSDFGSNILVQNCTSSGSAEHFTHFTAGYPGPYGNFPVMLANVTLYNSSITNSVNGIFSTVGSTWPIYNVKAIGCTLNGAALGSMPILNGTFAGASDGSWIGWEVNSCVFQDHVYPTSGSGNNVALWLNNFYTSAAYPSQGQNIADAGGGSGPISIFPRGDRYYLNNNTTAGAISIKIDPSPGTLATYPTGYLVTLIPASKTNWTVQASGTWNTLGGDQAITPTNNVTLRKNSGGKFDLVPTLQAIETSTVAYTQGGAAAAITSTTTISTAGGATLTSATISIMNGFVVGDTLNFATIGAISGSYSASTGVLTLSGSDTRANYQAALRTVTFSRSTGGPSTTRTISFRVNDGTNDSNTIGRQVVVTATSGSPVLANIEGTTQTCLAGGSASITAALTASDASIGTFSSATVTISANQAAGDKLTFSNTPSIVSSWDGTSVLTLSGIDAVANYQAAIRATVFAATATGSTRTLSIAANDGLAASNTQTRSLSVSGTASKMAFYKSAFYRSKFYKSYFYLAGGGSGGGSSSGSGAGSGHALALLLP